MLTKNFNCLLQINKSKIICECLIASEGVDLKFEEAFLLFLLGQVNLQFPLTLAMYFLSLECLWRSKFC